MKELVTSLKKKHCCHIGHVTPRRRSEYVIQLAEEFFQCSNFVPGFPDLLVVMRPEHRNKFIRIYREYNLSYGLTFRISKNYKPDLIWVDDIKRIEAIAEEYGSTPIIYSTSPARKDGLHIISDSREQRPLFESAERLMMSVGDYTTKRLFGKFHIERKSPQDLYGTITKGHVRFRNELIRAEVYNIKLAMFVECSKRDFIEKNFPGANLRQIPGETLEKIINTIEHRYKMEVVWCKNRDLTKSKVLSRLKAEEKINNGFSKVSNGKPKKKKR